jgi:hypothetical protein
MLPRTVRPRTFAPTLTRSAARAPSGWLAPQRAGTAPASATSVPSPSEEQLLRQADILCGGHASCDCPPGEHASDAERAVMDDLFRQASRLTAVFAWTGAVVVLVLLVVLMLLR